MNRKISLFVAFSAFFGVLSGILPLNAAITEETVFYDVPDAMEPNPIPVATAGLLAMPGYPNDSERLTLIARLYVPDAAIHGVGPYPAVIILHGSGGLWSSDVITNGLISQFEQWGELLAGLGYLAIFPDSYNPRGIPANFGSRRPHYNPAIDDHVCSPNYERPKDVIATLTYLTGRSDFDGENVALMGFSHGAQTGINAVLDVSVDLGQYQVSYIDQQAIPDTDPVQYEEVSTTKNVDSPVRIPNTLPFPKLCAFYYGGGSHYGYHGSASSVAAGRYMFDRRTKVLMFHGTADSLLGVNDPEASPMTGNLYPIKQALASSAQALALGVSDPLQHHFILHQVGHSFDLTTIAAPIDWNSNQESADQKAKRLCREETLKWIEFALKPAPATSVEVNTPAPGQVTLEFQSNPYLRYQWDSSLDLVNWSHVDSVFDGDGNTANKELNGPLLDKKFFRLSRAPIPPPLGNLENSGFFKVYQDFSL